MLDTFIDILKTAFIAFLSKIGDFYNSVVSAFGIWAILDIILTTLIFWWLFALFRGEKTKKVVWLILILTGLYLGSNVFDLTLLNLITKYLAVMFVVSLPIIFNKEIQAYFLDKKIDKE